MNEYIPIANLALNLLFIPLVLILNGIRIELAKLTSTIESHAERIERIERHQDNH